MPKGLLGIMRIIENKWYILILTRNKLTISIRFLGKLVDGFKALPKQNK